MLVQHHTIDFFIHFDETDACTQAQHKASIFLLLCDPIHSLKSVN